MATRPQQQYEEDPTLLQVLVGYKRQIILGIVGVILLIFMNPIACVRTGHRGVITTFGAVSGRILDEGITLIIPFIQSVKQVNVQIQKHTVDAAAASKDLQTVQSKITVNYHIAHDQVNWLYQNVGNDYEETVITPSIQEIVKASTAKHDAAELIVKREAVKIEIETALQEKLNKFHIVVDQVAVENFHFSEQFAQAIEAKQQAEQLALKAERDLERIKTEAEQRVATAQAEAQAFRLQSQALTPQMIQMEWIKKWSGNVPQVNGSGGNFMFQMPMPGAAGQ